MSDFRILENRNRIFAWISRIIMGQFRTQPAPGWLYRLDKPLLILEIAPHNQSGLLAHDIWYKCHKKSPPTRAGFHYPLMTVRNPMAEARPRLKSCRWASRLESIVDFFLPSYLSSLLPLSLPYLLHKLFRSTKVDVAGLKTSDFRAISMGSVFLPYLSLRHNCQDAIARYVNADSVYGI